MALRYFNGSECTGALLAQCQGVTNPAVVAQLDEIISQVRLICPDDEFVALERDDQGWIFVPTIGTGTNKNLCTVWFGARSVNFDVRSQQELDGMAGRRRYPDAAGPTFVQRLSLRYSNMASAWLTRNT